jgi:hypothetical protein
MRLGRGAGSKRCATHVRFIRRLAGYEHGLTRRGRAMRPCGGNVDVTVQVQECEGWASIREPILSPFSVAVKITYLCHKFAVFVNDCRFGFPSVWTR